jgi:hypothetical protein
LLLYLNKKIEKSQFWYSLFLQFIWIWINVSSCVLLKGRGWGRLKKTFLKLFAYKNAIKHLMIFFSTPSTPSKYLQKNLKDPPAPLPGVSTTVQLWFWGMNRFSKIVANYQALKHLLIWIICDFKKIKLDWVFSQQSYN